jgi:hypothetical protein
MRSFAALVGALALSLVASSHGSEHAPAAAFTESCPRLVVRAHFDDPAMLSEVMWWTDPWEIDAPAGFLVVDVDADELARLHAAGFRVEVDEELSYALCEPREVPKDQLSGIPGFPCFRTVEETFAAAEAMARRHPDLVEWIDVGDSWEQLHGGEPGFGGYDLMVLRLTNRTVAGIGTPNAPDSKPRLFVEGGLHAREYSGPELLMRFAEGLVDRYGIDADATWLLDEHDLHLLLFANPDGRKRAEAGVRWRKNANNDYCTNTDLRGADLNRNFEYEWNCCGNSSSDPCHEAYRGATAASEPETQAVQTYLEAIFPVQWTPVPTVEATGVFIDLHSYGSNLGWPWFHMGEPGPNNTELTTLGRRLGFLNGYLASEVYGFIDGSAADFAYGTTGVASYLFELGTAFFQDCETFETTVLPANLSALRYAAKVARAPYLTPSGPSVTSIALAPGPLVDEGDVITVEVIADDTGFRSHGSPEPTQRIAAVRMILDRPPWRPGPPAAVAMDPADGAFDSPEETAVASLDTTGLGPGRHTLFVEARDGSGTWGAVSAEHFWLPDPRGPVRHPRARYRP